MAKPRLFLQLIFLKSDFKPNHTANLIHNPKLRPNSTFFNQIAHFVFVAVVSSDNRLDGEDIWRR